MSEFLGDVMLKEIPRESRKMVVLFDFAYLDNNGLLWPCFRGDVIDGASIPRAFWTIFGSPYTGAYRRSAAPHDTAYMYQLRTRPQADRMLYEAARCDRTSATMAWTMLRAVRNFGQGPWDDLDQGDHNDMLVPDVIADIPSDVMIPDMYKVEMKLLKAQCEDLWTNLAIKAAQEK